MKTKVKRMSKRTLALFLGIMMLVTSISLGTILTANATTYYLHYNNTGGDAPANYGNHVEMTNSGNNYYATITNNSNGNVYFNINESSDNAEADNTKWLNSAGYTVVCQEGVNRGQVQNYGNHDKVYIYASGSYSNIYITLDTNDKKIYASTTNSGSGGETTYTDIYVRGDTSLTGGDFTVQDSWKMTTTDGTNYTLVKTNVSAGSYEYKFATSDWSTQYPTDATNLSLDVETSGSTVTFTYTLNGTGTATVEAPATGVFEVDDYDIQYTWINSKDCSKDGANKSTNIEKIELVAGHNNLSYDWYVPVVFADANTSSSHDKYFYGTATQDNGTSGTQKFTVSIGDLDADTYEIKVGVLGFENQAEAEAVEEQTATSFTIGDNFSSNGTSKTWRSDANRTLTVSDDTTAYASITARLTVNGVSEGKTFAVKNDDDENITFVASSNNGNTAVKTADTTIEAKSALSYSFSYYYTKGNGSAVKIGSTRYQTADNSTKPVVSDTYTIKLSDLGEFDDGDVLSFYVLMQGFSDADHTTAITNPNNSSEEKGLIYGRISDSVKDSKVSGSTELWVDTAPQNSDSNTLVKWNNKSGPSGTRSEYYFYLPKNDYVDISRGTYDDQRLVFYYDTTVLSDVAISSDGTNYYPISSGETFHNNNLYIKSGTTYTIKYTVNGTETTRSVIFKQGSEAVAQLYLDTPSDMYDATSSTPYADLKSQSEMKGNSLVSVKASGSQDLGSTAIKKIKGRGNSSWEASTVIFGKYAYNLTLSDAVNLFGLAGSGNKNKKYCLLANDFDSTQARNAYIFNFAKSMGLDYTPNYQMVELYNNGTYLGSYLVTQKVELGSKALVNKEEEIEQADKNGTEVNTENEGYYSGTDTASNYKTGTYMLEFEIPDRLRDEVSYFKSAQGQGIVVTSPEYATKTEIDFIKSKWDEVETAVYDHRLDEVRDKIDVDSFVKMYLIQDLSKNLDSSATSFNILYKAKEGKFYAQPVWDYDWALGNYNQTKNLYGTHSNGSNSPSSTTGYFSRYKAMGDGNQNEKYNFQAMLCDNESFWADVQNIWANSAGSKATTENTNLAAYMEDIADSITMNDTRWGHIAINNGNSTSTTWGTTPSQGTTYSAVSSWLTNWITNRIAYFNDSTNGIAKSGSSTNTYTIGVATNWNEATTSISAIGIDTIENSTSSFTGKTTEVPEYTYVTFKTTASDSSKEFKGWFTTTDPATSGGTVNNDNAVSMDEEFSAMVRSDVKIYALYSDKQDDTNGGIVSGKLFYYSAPEVVVNVYDKTGEDAIHTATKGDTVTIKATINTESVQYIDRLKQDDFVPQYIYNFYTMDDNGNKTIIDSQVGAKTGDERKVHSLKTTFSETTTYYVEAYCVNVDPDESPFSVGKSNTNAKVINDTVINTENIKVYVDLTGKTVGDTAPVLRATDADGIIQEYTLEQLGSSDIYVANDVVAAYATKNNNNTSRFTIVSINVNGSTISIPDAQQPELSSLLAHKTLWYKATGNTVGNYSQSYYSVKGNVDTHENTDEFVNAVYRTQGSELSTKRIYLTNNLTDNFNTSWEFFNVVYTVDKNVKMYNSGSNYGYSDNHDDYVWFTKRMENAGYGNVDAQGLLYVDLPYNVTAYYFENGKFGSSDKLEVHYVNGATPSTVNSVSGYGTAGESHNDVADVTGQNSSEINAYYISNYKTSSGMGYVRLWPNNDWPKTAYLETFMQDIFIAKGETLDITPDAQNADVGIYYDSADTSVATVSAGGILSAKAEGSTTVTITPVGYANGTQTQAPGIVQTVKVTVVDKDDLRKMISEAEDIIAAHNAGTGPDYNADSYDSFEEIYSSALDVYNKSLYSQTEIDYFTALLNKAMANLYIESGETSNYFTLIAYNSSKVTVLSDGHGNVSAPTIDANYTNTVKTLTSTSNSINIDKTTIAPYVNTVKENEEYILLYAEGIKFTSTASVKDVAFPFSNWTMDDETYDTAAISKTAAAGSSEYLANFSAPDYTLNLTYKFKDFDIGKAGSNEYKDGCEADNDSTYNITTTLTAEEAKASLADVTSNETKVYELAVNFTPDVVSSYYNYKFPTSTTDETKYKVENKGNNTIDATIYLSNSMRKYSLYLNGNVIGTNYHYQEEVKLDAIEDANLSQYESYIWFVTDKANAARSFDESKDSPLGYKEDGETSFRLRVLEDDMYVNVYQGTNIDGIDGTSISSYAYPEVVYKSDGTKRLQQNFYIQDNLKDKENLVGAGNLYYYWNTATNRPATSNLNNSYQSNKNLFTVDSLETLVKNNYSTWANNLTNGKASGTVNYINYTYYVKPSGEADPEGLLRYSTINNFYSYYFAVNSAENAEKYANWTYRVHSFMVYRDGSEVKVAVSKTYAEAAVHWDTN